MSGPQGTLPCTLEELQQRLAQHLVGLEFLDRDLALDGSCRIDLVAVDGVGRLVLVLCKDAGAEGAVLRTLDCLAWARTHLEHLAHHLGAERFRPELDPLIVLVSEAFEQKTLDRLSPLVPSSVRTLELCELRSANSESSHLREVGLGETVAELRPPEFLEGLSEEQKRAANGLISHLERIDDDVLCESTEGGLRWSFRGLTLCTLSLETGCLRGRFPGNDVSLPVLGPDDSEAFIDQTLTGYVRALEELGDDDPFLPAVELFAHSPGPRSGIPPASQ